MPSILPFKNLWLQLINPSPPTTLKKSSKKNTLNKLSRAAKKWLPVGKVLYLNTVLIDQKPVTDAQLKALALG